jgi:hypothetical protein
MERKRQRKFVGLDSEHIMGFLSYRTPEIEVFYIGYAYCAFHFNKKYIHRKSFKISIKYSSTDKY